jgi:hypothetical protein
MVAPGSELGDSFWLISFSFERATGSLKLDEGKEGMNEKYHPIRPSGVALQVELEGEEPCGKHGQELFLNLCFEAHQPVTMSAAA